MPADTVVLLLSSNATSDLTPYHLFVVAFAKSWSSHHHCVQEVWLYDVGCITDCGISHLSDRLMGLESLSLSKCHHLTDKSLTSLSRSPIFTLSQ